MTAADCNENERCPFPLIRERQLKIRTKKILKNSNPFMQKLLQGFRHAESKYWAQLSSFIGILATFFRTHNRSLQAFHRTPSFFWVKLGSQICSDIDSINMDLCQPAQVRSMRSSIPPRCFQSIGLRVLVLIFVII